jgi:hypothetical protein
MEPASSRHQIEPIIKAEWAKLNAGIPPVRSFKEFKSWSFAISPAIPAAWPPNGSGVVHYYAYARAVNPMMLMDGEFTAAPWARLTVDTTRQGSNPAIEILMTEVREIGIQPVRPITAKEQALFEKDHLADDELRAMSQRTSAGWFRARLARRYLRAWCDLNSTIAALLRRRHKPFFRWAGCR